MEDPGRYPGGLLGRKQIVIVCRFHLSYSLQGVLDLVEVVPVPIGHQVVTFEREGSGPDRAPATHVDHLRVGRKCQIIDRMRKDGHNWRAYRLDR